MLKPRIIPTLLLRNGRMVKGKNFSDYKDTGDPVFASKIYNSQYVDELIFIDIDATNEDRNPNIDILKKVSKVCFMPFTIGGGIKNIDQIRELLLNGADKVMINTAAAMDTQFILDAVDLFGSQCIVIGIDVKRNEDHYAVYTNSGKKKHSDSLKDHLSKIEKLKVGEIFINSIDNDGMMNGYDLDLIKFVSSKISIPFIASGGAGNFSHLYDAFNETDVSALAMASIYHFSDNNPIRCRSFLKNKGINLKVV